MAFGLTLSRLRRSRNWSQEELAHRAGLSQRHISFLETGRSQPGQQSITKLVDAMALKGWEHRNLISALAPPREEDIERSHGPQFIEDFVERATPWPAYAFNPDGSVIVCNRAMDCLVALASPTEDLWEVTRPEQGANIYDLVFHPMGLVRWMLNPEVVIPETLRRLRVEASHDRALSEVLARSERYESVSKHCSVSAIAPSVLTERYRINGTELAVISVLSHLASPGELALDTMRIESFVPADTASHDFLAELYQDWRCHPDGIAAA